MTSIKLNAEQTRIANLGKETNEMGAARVLDQIKHNTNFNNPHNVTAAQIQAVHIDDMDSAINVLVNPELIYACRDVQLMKPDGSGYYTIDTLDINLEGDQVKLRCKNMYNSGEYGDYLNCVGDVVEISMTQLVSKITYFVFVFISTAGEAPDTYPDVYPKEVDANGYWYLAATFEDLQKTQAQKPYYDIIISKLPLGTQLGFFVGFTIGTIKKPNMILPVTTGAMEA